jgi:thymidylate kinase
MVDHLRGSFLVALCGVDGVGKSTIVAALRQRPLFSDAAFLKKEDRRNLDLLKRWYDRDQNDFRDWNRGPFAELAAVGSALEFLHHNETAITPALLSHRLVVCDRHALCYAAFLAAVAPEVPHAALFRKVRKPDLIIWISVPSGCLSVRLDGRGGAEEDENSILSGILSDQYEKLIDSYSVASVRIDNSGAIVETVTAVESAILYYLDASTHQGE